MKNQVQFEFSEKILKRMVRDKIISDPITEEDDIFLDKLKSIWQSNWYLGQMAMGKSEETRKAILLFPNFSKIDRYVLNTYLNLEVGEKISVKTIVERIKTYFGVVNYGGNDVIRIRQTAYNLRRETRNKSKDWVAYELDLLDKLTFGGDKTSVKNVLYI